MNYNEHMPNYRYVTQGEYFITTDPNTVLVTSSMTECIGFAIVDEKNRSNRLLCHLDGLTLKDKATALSNLTQLVSEFKTISESDRFAIHLFGGNKKLENAINLLAALKSLNLEPTQFVDAPEFCIPLNKKSLYRITASNAHLTLICDTKGVSFISYDSKFFTPPISENRLVAGEGLTSADEQKKYKNFIKLNTQILGTSSEAASRLRHCNDEKLKPPSETKKNQLG